MSNASNLLECRAGMNPSTVTPDPAHALDRDLQAMWDQAADWWAAHLRQDKNRRLQVFPLVLELLGDVAGRRVLDAGCGEGSFARLLAERGAEVTGVDFSRLLDSAIAQETESPRGIRYVKTGLASLDSAVPGGSFDAVVCNLVLHCLPDLEPALKSLAGQLKPGGLLVLSDFHPDTFSVFSRAWTECVPVGGIEFRYTLSTDCPELTLFLHSLEALTSACQRCGFTPVDTLAPAAPCPAAADASLPQFLYLRLRSDVHE